MTSNDRRRTSRSLPENALTRLFSTTRSPSCGPTPGWTCVASLSSLNLRPTSEAKPGTLDEAPLDVHDQQCAARHVVRHISLR